MQKTLLYATIGCAVLWSLNGIVRLVGVHWFKDGGSAKEGWFHLFLGAGWTLTAFNPDLWNWGVPTLLMAALAFEVNKKASKSAVSQKAD